MQQFTLHTHSLGFDGRNTVTEMIDRAKSLGMTAIGISNHFIVHPRIKKSNMYPYAVRGGYSDIYSASFNEVIHKFKPHYEQLRRLADNSEISVLCGMEVDFFNTPEWYCGFAHAIKILKPDYVIGSAHFVDFNNNLCNVHDMANASPNNQNAMLARYWNNIKSAANSGLFTWLAHLDLPKKVGLGGDDAWAPTERDVIANLARTGARIEINTGAFSDVCSEPYPSARILKQVAAYQIPVLISDDAHSANQIGRHFERAEQIARDCGITRFLQLDELGLKHR